MRICAVSVVARAAAAPIKVDHQHHHYSNFNRFAMPLNPLIHFAVLIETACQSTPNNLHSFGFCFTCLKCPFNASHSSHHIHITLTDYPSYRHPPAKYRANRKIMASNSWSVHVDYALIFTHRFHCLSTPNNTQLMDSWEIDLNQHINVDVDWSFVFSARKIVCAKAI